MLIITYKSTLPSTWTYPVGLETLEQSLYGIPASHRLEVAFHYVPSMMEPPHTQEPYHVLSVYYRNVGPGRSGTPSPVERGYQGETWELTVYAVPRAARADVQGLLQSEGLKRVRTWIAAERAPEWFHGRKDLTLKFDPATTSLLFIEHAL